MKKQKNIINIYEKYLQILNQVLDHTLDIVNYILKRDINYNVTIIFYINLFYKI